jgi:hypothetical protein
MPDGNILIIAALGAMLIWGGVTVTKKTIHVAKKAAHVTAKSVVWTAKRIVK